MKKRILNNLVFTTFALMLIVTMNPILSKAATYYTNYNTGSPVDWYFYRTKVTSSLDSKTKAKVDRQKVGGVDNSKSKTPTDMSVSLTKTKSRTFSLALTLDTPLSILASDVSATLGGSVAYSESKSLTCSKKLKAHEIGEVYLYYEKEVATFKYVCQKQRARSIDKPYKNSGSSYKKYGTSTTKVPFLEPVVRK